MGLVIKIGKKTIGDGFSTYIIAEIGICHNGDVDIAKKLIDSAAEAKVDAVKFQMRDLELIYPRDVLENPWKYEHGFQYLIPILKETELTLFDHIKLKEHAEGLGLEYICTPFDSNSVSRLSGMGVKAYKIASCDLTNFGLLGRVAVEKRPMILSTGMSTWAEIETTVRRLKTETNAEFALLHCRSAYPVWPREVNLSRINELKKFGVPVGYSDHTIGITIPTIAAAIGASIVECHITLDQKAKGPDHKISLLPEELKILVRDIRISDMAMQDSDRQLLRGEVLNRDVFRCKGRNGYSKIDTLKLDHEPVGKWGLISRPHDMSVMEYEPKCVEFHLTEQDLDTVPKLGHYDAELIVHCPEYISDKIGDLCSGSDDIREASIRIAQATLDWTRAISGNFKGDPKVIVHPGAVSMNARLKPNVMANNLIRSLDVIDDRGCELILENLPPNPVYLGGMWKTNFWMSSAEIREFCVETGVNICFDLSHAALWCNSSGYDLVKYIEEIQEFIIHMHISDAFGTTGEGIQIGEGDIDLKKILPMLDFENTTWVPEPWQGHKFGNRGFIIALNKINEILIDINR